MIAGKAGAIAHLACRHCGRDNRVDMAGFEVAYCVRCERWLDASPREPRTIWRRRLLQIQRRGADGVLLTILGLLFSVFVGWLLSLLMSFFERIGFRILVFPEVAAAWLIGSAVYLIGTSRYPPLWRVAPLVAFLGGIVAFVVGHAWVVPGGEFAGASGHFHVHGEIGTGFALYLTIIAFLCISFGSMGIVITRLQLYEITDG